MLRCLLESQLTPEAALAVLPLLALSVASAVVPMLAVLSTCPEVAVKCGCDCARAWAWEAEGA